MDNIEQIAQRLGMKPGEIVKVMEAADGVLVETHDWQWTLIRNDGELVFRVDPPVDPDDAIRESLEDVVDLAEEITEAEAAMLRGFHGEPEPETQPAPKTKPAPKRRSNQ